MHVLFPPVKFCHPSSLEHGCPGGNATSAAVPRVICKAAAPPDTSTASQVAPSKEVAAGEGDKASQVAAAVEATIDQSLPEGEKERLRRERISQANRGRPTWNKGRKHRPETIAKIKARTAEAMMRQDVVDAYKASMEPVLEEKRLQAEARKAQQKEEKAKAAAAAKAAREEAAAARAAARAAAAAERAKNPKPRAKPKPPPSELRQGETANSEASTSAPKKRAPYSEEHRRRISEAIRAKWQDAEYRARARAAMMQATQERQAWGAPGSSAPSSSTSRRRSSCGASKPKEPKQPSREQIVKEKLTKLQMLVKHIINSQDLVARTDMQLEATRLKVQAFENDPHMAAKAQGVVANVEAMLTAMRAKLDKLTSQLPPGTRFDRQGSISFASPEAAAALVHWSPPGMDGGRTCSTSPGPRISSASSTSPSSLSPSGGGSGAGAGAGSAHSLQSVAGQPPPTAPSAPIRQSGNPAGAAAAADAVAGVAAHSAHHIWGGGIVGPLSNGAGTRSSSSSMDDAQGIPPGPVQGGSMGGHHVWVEGLGGPMGANPLDLPPGHLQLSAELAARAAAAAEAARRRGLQGGHWGGNEQGRPGQGQGQLPGAPPAAARNPSSSSSSSASSLHPSPHASSSRRPPASPSPLPAPPSNLKNNGSSSSSSRSGSEQPAAPKYPDFTPSTRTRRARRSQ